jgi:hypothetical protein
MSQMPTTAPLPPGWESKMTPEGRVYFIDHKTGRTQWEPPTAAAQAPSAPNTSAGLGTAQYGATATARPTTAVSGGGGLPPGWEATVDPSSGKTYYLDHNTRQTHWELPAANPRAAAATSGAGGQQDYSAQWSAYYAAQRAQQMQQVQVQQQRQHAAEQQHYAPRGTGKRGAPAAPSKDPPPEGYVCRLCQVAGHWIQDCPGAVSSLDKAVIVGVPPTVVRACQRASERLPSTPPPLPYGGLPCRCCLLLLSASRVRVRVRAQCSVLGRTAIYTQSTEGRRALLPRESPDRPQSCRPLRCDAVCCLCIAMRPCTASQLSKRVCLALC